MSALEERLRQYALSGDRSLVLDPSARSEAADLLAATDSLLDDPKVAAAVGLLHFLAFMASADDQEQLLAACVFFAPLVDRHPDVVPDLARAFLSRLRRKRQAPEAHPVSVSLRNALNAKHATAATWSDLLWQLGRVLHDNYSRTGDAAVLAEALAVLRHAAQATDAGNPERSRRYSNLGALLQRGYLETGDISLLRAGVEAHGKATIDTAHADYPQFLFNSSSALFSLYEHGSQVTDLVAAIAAGRAAVAGTRPDHAGYPARAGHLGMCLLASYQELGHDGDLRESLRFLRLAVSGPGDEDVRRESIVPALGSALAKLFVRTGDLGALDEAIKAHRRAMSAPSPESVRTARDAQQAANLAGVLMLHFDRTRQRRSLEEAISWLYAAKVIDEQREVLPRAAYGALRGNLSVALLERHQLTGSPADLDEAIAQGRRALSGAARTDRAAVHSILGQALVLRFLLSKQRGLLSDAQPELPEEALAELRAAVGERAGDSPARATALANLGNALLLASDDSAAAEAGEAFGQAAESLAAPPRVRAESGLAGGRLAAEHRDWDLAARCLEIAVSMLERAVPPSHSRSDREHQLKRLRDLPSDAAACALNSGDAERAAVLFEQGRGVLLAQALGQPAGLDKLASQRPDLKERFEQLRGEVDDYGALGTITGSAPAGHDKDWAGQVPAERRAHLAGKWDELLDQIRREPGLDRFLMPPLAADLRAAAGAGPIILVYASDYGSAGLIVRADGIRSVPLPDLSPKAVRAMVAELLTVQDDAGMKSRERRLTGMLGWLWDAVAEPIMNDDAITEWTTGGLAGSRLWWCPAGLLSFLPLHAAGHHGTSCSPAPTVMDRVISSYTPTIRLLAHARRGSSARGDGQAAGGRTLIVTAGPAGGSGQLAGLPAAKTEAAWLRAQTAAVDIDASHATCQDVLAELRRRPRVHVACHAVSDLGDPSSGYLHLHDGDGGRVTVADIVSLRPEHAELAFLSACSTIQGGPGLADEAIHLSSAFQVAGYRNVIATLWPIHDAVAPRITKAFYQGIAAPAGLTATAASLHRATCQQRARSPHAPSSWAAHVHSGT